MNEYDALVLAALLMERHGVDRHWRVKFENELPIRGGTGYLWGHTSWDNRIVRLSRSLLRQSPSQVQATIEHEIAHVMTPEDWVHGEVFKAKLEEIRNAR